jgi:acetylornithine deacetylase/succinyl-diaminopimelate desuccinylase-like protein
VSVEAPLVSVLSRALEARGLSTTPLGMSAWTDAALLNAAGVPAVCFGPGDMAMAHAAEEYIEVSEIEAATEILTDFAREWCN